MSIKALREFVALPAPKLAPRLRDLGVPRPAAHGADLPGHSVSPAVATAQILIPVDFSDASLRALNFAGSLARRFGASIGLLHVVALVRFPGRRSRRQRDVAYLQRETSARIQEWQAVAVSPCRRAGAEVAVGQPAAEIVAAAERLRTDLVVLAAGSRNWLTRFLRGGTAAGVLNAATRPVLVIPERLLVDGGAGIYPGTGSFWNDLLVPISATAAGQPALRYAAAWASVMKSRLTLFRVLGPGAGASRGNPFQGRRRLEDSDLQAVARREVGEGIEVQVLPEQGVADAEVILKAAAAARSEMVVLTLDKTGRRIARGLARAGRCAVLAAPEPFGGLATITQERGYR